ncbi:MAG: hypothetical protein AAF235_04460 [Planctomycetota bacterium]
MTKPCSIGVLLGLMLSFASLGACSPTYFISVENRAGKPVDARFVYDRYLQDPQVLAASRLSDGERTDFGPYELDAFEEVYVEVIPANDPYELPTRFRIEDKDGTVIVESNGIEAIRPLSVRWDVSTSNSGTDARPRYSHPAND